MRFFGMILVLLFALRPGTAAAAPTVTSAGLDTVDSSAHTFVNASSDQERIVSHGNYQYAAYWDADQKLSIVRVNLTSGAKQILHFADAVLHDLVANGGKGSIDLPDGGEWDGHRSISLGISLGDGRLHVSYGNHRDRHNYRASQANWVTSPPSTISVNQWNAPGYQIADTEEDSATYPRFFNDSQGNLFFSFRTGLAHNGRQHLRKFVMTPSPHWERVGNGVLTDGKAHSDPKLNGACQTALSMVACDAPDANYCCYRGAMGVDPNGELFITQGTNGFKSPTRYSYLYGIRFDTNDRLHMLWAWREAGGLDNQASHDINYAYSDDYGVTWTNRVGTLVANLAAANPIIISDPGLVVQSEPQGYWTFNAGGMTLDSQNLPHIAGAGSTVQTVDIADINMHYYHGWLDASGTWRAKTVDNVNVPKSYLSAVNILMDPADNAYVFYTKNDLGWEHEVTHYGNLPNMRWDSSGALVGAVSSFGQVLHATPYNINLDAAASNAKQVRVRMSTSGLSTGSDAIRLAWTTTTNGNWATKDVSFTSNAAFANLVFDLGSNGAWTGTIKRLSITPVTSSTAGTYTIDWIKITDSAGTVAARTWNFTTAPQFYVGQALKSQNWQTWSHYSPIPATPLQIWDEAFHYDRQRYAASGRISINVLTQSSANFGLGCQDFVILP